MRLLDATSLWDTAGGLHRVLAAKHDWLPQMQWQHRVLAPGHIVADTRLCTGWPLAGGGGRLVAVSTDAAQRAMESLQPDVIEVADAGPMAHAALRAAERLNVPAVAACHGHLPSMAARLVGNHPLLARRAESAARRHLLRLYERFDHVLAPSRWLVQDLRSLGLRHVWHQPLGVDCGNFTPARRDMPWRLRWQAALGLERSERLLLYAGRFSSDKRLDLLADAVRRLGRGHTLIAVGAGPCPPRGDQVRVLQTEARQPQLARLLASCDVVVHAGDQEAFGLGALEAMACATPLVTSASGGLGEIAYGVGITLAEPDAGRWAEAMHSQLTAPDTAALSAGLARAHAHHGPRMLELWLLRYRQRVETASRAPAVAGAAPIGAALAR